MTNLEFILHEKDRESFRIKREIFKNVVMLLLSPYHYKMLIMIKMLINFVSYGFLMKMGRTTRNILTNCPSHPQLEFQLGALAWVWLWRWTWRWQGILAVEILHFGCAPWQNPPHFDYVDKLGRNFVDELVENLLYSQPLWEDSPTPNFLGLSFWILPWFPSLSLSPPTEQLYLAEILSSLILSPSLPTKVIKILLFL